MENISTKCEFYFKFLRIVHQIAFVLQVRFYIVLLSQEYATQDVYLLLKKNSQELSCAGFFFNRRQGTIENFLTLKLTNLVTFPQIIGKQAYRLFLSMYH